MSLTGKAVAMLRYFVDRAGQLVPEEELSTIYIWCTEGFATEDLQEAKTLIQELSE